MERVLDYVKKAARYFESELASLVEVYQLGSLAHGGFSPVYSDIDVGILLNCPEPPPAINHLIENSKKLDPDIGHKLSVFWGNPNFPWGRFPALDRVDLLDHGIPLLYGRKAQFTRPQKAEIRTELLASVEKSWKPRVAELRALGALASQQRKPYIRTILYPARLIYSWDRLAVHSNDSAVEYLQQVAPAGLAVEPILRALQCRRGQCTAEEVFLLRPDLDAQLDRTMAYISTRT